MIEKGSADIDFTNDELRMDEDKNESHPTIMGLKQIASGKSSRFGNVTKKPSTYNALTGDSLNPSAN